MKQSLFTNKISLLVGLVAMAVLFGAASCKNSSTETQTASEKGELPTPSDLPAGSEKFRKGLMKYGDPQKFGDFLIRRTATSQIDSGILTQLVVKFDLTWDSDTEYTLKYNSIVSNPQSIGLPDLKGMFRKCWMSEFTDSSYLETSTSSLNKDTIRTPIVLAK